VAVYAGDAAIGSVVRLQHRVGYLVKLMGDESLVLVGSDDLLSHESANAHGRSCFLF
jgi:hypothetical protein